MQCMIFNIKMVSMRPFWEMSANCLPCYKLPMAYLFFSSLLFLFVSWSRLSLCWPQWLSIRIRYTHSNSIVVGSCSVRHPNCQSRQEAPWPETIPGLCVFLKSLERRSSGLFWSSLSLWVEEPEFFHEEKPILSFCWTSLNLLFFPRSLAFCFSSLDFEACPLT